MDYIDRLRRFAVNDPRLDADLGLEPTELAPRDVALIRLAALVAVGGVAVAVARRRRTEH